VVSPMAAVIRLRRRQDYALVAVAKVACGSWGFSLASSYARRVPRRGEVDHALFHTFCQLWIPDWHLAMVSSTHGERTALWHARVWVHVMCLRCSEHHLDHPRYGASRLRPRFTAAAGMATAHW
jgi:hypothetical protein